MNNGVIVRSAFAVLSLVVLLFIFAFVEDFYVNQQNAEQAEQTGTYQELHTHHFAPGETASLNSDEDAEGKQYDWEADFDWDGTVDATVAEAKIYALDDSVVDGLISKQDIKFAQEVAKDSVALLVTLELENVDAVSLLHEDEKGWENMFDISTFSVPEDICCEPVYFDSSYSAKESPFYFELEKGQTKTVRCIWLVSAADMEDGTEIWIGIDQIGKYIFDIPSTGHEGVTS